MSKNLTLSNLNSFFRSEICKSAEAQGLLVSEDVVDYLSKIMGSALINDKSSLANKDITLTELYINAKIEKRDSFYKFKKLGDVSIVKAGLFPGTRARLVGKNYYIDMGASAYGLCYKKSGNKTYKKLSLNIDKYCDIIYGAKSCAITNNILALYDDWNSTRSSFSKRRLIALGFSLSNMRGEEEC